MARPSKVLSEQELKDVKAAWVEGDHSVDYVAEKIGKTWQTARRWLMLAGCIDVANEALDRPGLRWPVFDVKIDDLRFYVEAPNWAFAIEAVSVIHNIDVFSSAAVYQVGGAPDGCELIQRKDVRDAIDDFSPSRKYALVQHYATLGVKR